MPPRSPARRNACHRTESTTASFSHSSGHGSGPRGADPHPGAVRAGRTRTLGARLTDRAHREHLGPERHEQMHVHVGRRHFDHQRRDDENRYPLRAMGRNPQTIWTRRRAVQRLSVLAIQLAGFSGVLAGD